MAIINIEIQTAVTDENIQVNTTAGDNIDVTAGGIPGPPGPQGPAGPAGSTDEVQAFVCGENISSGTAIAIKPDGLVYKYDPSNPAFYEYASGIAAQSGSTGGTINVNVFGVITVAASGWALGNDYFIGANGLLVTSPQSTILVFNIGTGLGTDKILINKQPIILTS